MLPSPYVYVSSHTGSELLGWNIYGTGQYRALDPHTLRVHCPRVNSQLTKEDVARLLLSVLAKYGQIVSNLRWAMLRVALHQCLAGLRRSSQVHQLDSKSLPSFLSKGR